MKHQLLLLEDVDDLGRSGDVVSVRAGYSRNFLVPKKKAIFVDTRTVKLQARLQEERAKKAAVDKQAAEEQAAKLQDVVLKTEVKVDQDGKMYGSVSAVDIARLLQDKGYAVERRHVVLHHAIKTIGTHTITLKLKEGVPALVKLEISVQGVIVKPPESASAQ